MSQATRLWMKFARGHCTISKEIGYLALNRTRNWTVTVPADVAPRVYGASAFCRGAHCACTTGIFNTCTQSWSTLRQRQGYAQHQQSVVENVARWPSTSVGCGEGTGLWSRVSALERLFVDCGEKCTLWARPQIATAVVEPYNTVVRVRSLECSHLGHLLLHVSGVGRQIVRGEHSLSCAHFQCDRGVSEEYTQWIPSALNIPESKASVLISLATKSATSWC